MSNSDSKVYRPNHRKLFVFGVALALIGLALVFDQSRSSAAPERLEKTNFRISPHARKGEYARGTGMMTPTAPLATITVDRTDDVAGAAACTAAPNDCSLRGAVAFANLNPGTTINVPAGTYNLTTSGAGEGFSGNNLIGDLDITGNNTSIIGAGAATTIINQTTAGDRVIEINPFLNANFVTSISGVTISGGRESTGVGGGGIVSGAIGNILTLTDCVISGNSATGAGTFGGGGVSHTGGNLTITRCTFSGNSTSGSGGGVSFSAGDGLGRAPSAGTLAITGSTFTGNTANSNAAGGGALDLFNFNGGVSVYSVSSSSFSGNNAANGSGGAIIVESGPLTVTTSSLSNNHAGSSGGGIYSSGTSVSVAYSRLVGNTANVPAAGLTFFRQSGLFTANDNWWGVNTGASANDFRQSGGTVFPTTWLQLQASASPGSTCTGGTSTINANIKKRNAGTDLTVELNGLPPFPATFISETPSVGTVSGASDFVDGAASATFTAGATAGTANIDVTADNQTVTTSVTVETNTTSDPADQAVCSGNTATFTTTASGPGPITFTWKKGATTLNNGDLGGRVTITSGANSSTLTISSVQASDADTYTVDATGACNTASQNATLTVNSPTTTTDPADQTVCQGATANFSTTAGGTGPFHYAWTLDGSPFNGDNSSISVPTGSLSVGNHTVSVTTTGACGSASQSATLTVQANTSATTPADQTVCQGATANFSTTASGTGPFTYQWKLDGSNISGATSSSVAIDTTSVSVGGHTVEVVVGGTCGSVTKSASLTVRANTAATKPADQTVCKGTNANFSTTASGTGPFHYAWTVDGSPFNGDSASISVPTGSMSQGAHPVTVTVTGACGSAMQSATLTVQNTPPVITLSTSSVSMWPPNHQYQMFNVTDFVASASSSCDGDLTSSVVIASVSSDELEDNPGGADGTTLNDIVIAPDCKSVQLRAERDANLNGRVYTITFKVTDSVGHTTTATAKVTVPVNQSGAAAVDDGPGAGYTVTSSCP